MLEPEFMQQWGREEFGVAIPDGSGFMGTLNVYHELHALAIQLPLPPRLRQRGNVTLKRLSFLKELSVVRGETIIG